MDLDEFKDKVTTDPKLLEYVLNMICKDYDVRSCEMCEEILFASPETHDLFNGAYPSDDCLDAIYFHCEDCTKIVFICQAHADDATGLCKSCYDKEARELRDHVRCIICFEEGMSMAEDTEWCHNCTNYFCEDHRVLCSECQTYTCQPCIDSGHHCCGIKDEDDE